MFIGHDRNVRYLVKLLASGALAHAYLFHGPDAVGKRTLAVAVGQTLLCSGKSKSGLGGCGECDDCRLSGAGTHPDLICFSFERPLVEEDLKREIGIKNIHELQRLLALAPWRRGIRVVVIDGADMLSREAQPALLKTLEEPRGESVFFLVTDRPDALLPTISSRSVSMGFATVGDDDMAHLFRAVPEARRKLVIAFAAGRPGAARRLLSDSEFFNEFRRSESGFANVRNGHLGEQFAFSERASREPQELALFLKRFIRHERLLLLADLGSSAVVERAAFMRSLVDKLALMESTAANRRLVADSIFVELATRP